MVANSISLKAINELLGLKFYIPSYQRGYRWTKIQVEDLLNDIDEFKKNIGAKSSDFYCLQPLVVKETIPDTSAFFEALPKEASDMALQVTRDAISNNTRWEVIDGQQRLTTIFIILSYLSNCQEKDITCFDRNLLYELSYQTRAISKDFLSTIEKNISDESHMELIDFHFMREAYNTINTWFSSEDHNTIDYKLSFSNTLLNNVQFIWYETSEKSTSVFKRLNLGKIGLTNAELIKALFLNSVHYDNFDEKKVIIASQWDSFENTLQNEEFWLFIHSLDYDKPTRMEFIFDILCEMAVLDKYIDWKGNKKKVIGSDKYKTFRYFNNFFKSEKAHTVAGDEGLSIIELCWNEVKGLFRILEEWYTDLESYHYVGYLINEGMDIKDLLKMWSSRYNPDKKQQDLESKNAFKDRLKAKIKDTIANCTDLEKQYEVDNNDKKTVCRPLLLLHNIQVVIDQNKGFEKREDYKLGIFYKFPFHLYKKESWNVEHIDSNTTNSLVTETERYKWLKVSWYFLSGNDELRSAIKKFINSKGIGLDFDKLQSDIMAHFEKAGSLSPNDKNKVWNFVLLDEHTNKSYGNSIFPMKKMIISGKDHCIEYTLEDKTDDQNNFMGVELKVVAAEFEYKTAFVPPVTKAAFMKEYCPLSVNPYSWDYNDATGYRDNIENTLSEFLKR